MITLQTLTLYDTGECDYCNVLLEPGTYTVLDGYKLVSNPPGHSLQVGGPFVPCVDCYTMLGLPAISHANILAMHKIIAVKFNVPVKYISIEVE